MNVERPARTVIHRRALLPEELKNSPRSAGSSVLARGLHDSQPGLGERTFLLVRLTRALHSNGWHGSCPSLARGTTEPPQPPGRGTLALADSEHVPPVDGPAGTRYHSRWSKGLCDEVRGRTFLQESARIRRPPAPRTTSSRSSGSPFVLPSANRQTGGGEPPLAAQGTPLGA